MRLKEIELNGFKTFATQARFEFAESITAIVGPNGSGKSNIADAVRWVLGEQSYKLLRGRRTIDMIFSGSEERSRAGMASTTIVFDNSEGWLPIDFSEVSITRRAYRDGKNEYYINGQQVLLRDVNELLGQSGLAERTYTIIGQGLVDSALSLKAEERRSLFEEAAGIGLYRTRREESERRLEKTHRNLDRVEDILAELKPRLRSLEKQSQRFRQHARVKADLKMLMSEWYGYHWARVEEELSGARSQERQQLKILQEARRKQAHLDRELSEYQAEVQGYRARLNSWHRQLSEYHAERENISRELAVSDERLRSLNLQKEENALEIVRLEERLEDARRRMDEAKSQVSEHQEALNEARVRVSGVRQALQAKRDHQLLLQKKLDEARQKREELDQARTRLHARIDEREASIARLRASMDETNQKTEDIEAGARQAHEKRDLADKERQQVIGKRSALEEKLRALEEQIEQRRAEQVSGKEKLSEIQTDISRLEAQLNVIEQAENKLVGYANGARTLLSEARQGKIRGVLGALSAQIEVDEEYEIAVAAALGEYLDAVILETGTDPKNALQLLLKETTRGALLPLDSLAPQEPLDTRGKKITGLIGIAADLVRTRPNYRPAVDLLLGQVLVLENADAVRQALLAQPAGAKAVTLAGEVFYATGQIFAGREGTPSTLSRSRQLREDQARLEVLIKQEKRFDKELREMGVTLDGLEEDRQDLMRQIEETRRAERKQEELFNQAVLEEEQAGQKLNWHRDQLNNLQEEINLNLENITRLKKEIFGIKEQAASLAETIVDHENALKEVSLQEDRSQVAHWETEAAVAERALSDARERLEERRNSFQELQSMLEGSATRQDQLDGEIQTLRDRMDVLQGQEKQIMEEIEEVQTLIQPAEENLEGSAEKQDTLRSSESEARRVMNRQERQYAQAQIQYSRAKEQMENMRERIKEDIGLVEFSYGEDMSGPTPLPLDGWVEKLPRVESIPEGLGDTIRELRGQLRRLGAVNPEAQTEYMEVKERYEFMTEQLSDLRKAEGDLKEVIAELEVLMEREFRKTFDAVAGEFRGIFTRLFGGGEAKIILTDPDELALSGVDIEARLPGRRTQGLSLLSGGERSLTAAALIFSLLKVSPTPFCILDEVDAMLDEANVARYRELLRELSAETQFILITHNRNTVQAADVIYGITMNTDSTSQVISLKLDEVEELVD